MGCRHGRRPTWCFFQAEDGIRDYKVTGVQTCALPILSKRVGDDRQCVDNHRDGENLKNYRIAVIEGDGIGREVVPQGIRVLEAAGRRFDLSFSWQRLDLSCEKYVKTGRMMPEDGLEQLRPFDAIYLGAVGYPGLPDHISLSGF